jgi:large subunit ribosomal protein L21
MESTTYAIIRTGGKQYRVAQGQTLRVEKIEKDDGAVVSFDVLFVKDGERVQTGTPVVAGASVTGEIVRQLRDRKLLVFKKRSKKGYKKLQGHRQNITEVRIKSIQAAA